MPAVQTPSTVLVTGASGFIAAWVVKSFLDQGFSVVGTVRSAAKGRYLEDMFRSEYAGKFRYTIVQDIAKVSCSCAFHPSSILPLSPQPGAFDEAVKNVDAVAHTASPFHLTGTKPSDYYDPALNGTLGVLRSVANHGCVSFSFLFWSCNTLSNSHCQINPATMSSV